MIYSTSITSGKQGDSDANRSVILPVTRGLVYRFEVEFPPGCCGLLQCRVFDGSYQVYPSSRDDSFHSDARVIGFDDSYLKVVAPFEFRIETINTDTTWSHTIQVRIGMASTDAFMSRYMPSIAWDKFHVIMAQAAIDQAAMQKATLAAAVKDLGGLSDE